MTILTPTKYEVALSNEEYEIIDKACGFLNQLIIAMNKHKCANLEVIDYDDIYMYSVEELDEVHTILTRLNYINNIC